MLLPSSGWGWWFTIFDPLLGTNLSKRESYNHLNLQDKIITCNISHHLLQGLREATRIKRLNFTKSLHARRWLNGDTPGSRKGRWGCFAPVGFEDESLLKVGNASDECFFGNVDLEIVKLNNVWMLKMNPFHMYLLYIYILCSSIYIYWVSFS